MKIVFLADDFPPISFGGAGISTYELALGMRRAGNDVSVITTCREVNDAGEFIHDGLRVHRIQNNYAPRWRAWLSMYNPPVIRRVRKILEDEKPDVVHINNVHHYLSYHCFYLAHQYAKTVVFTARDTMSVCFGKLHTRKYLNSLNPRTTWIDHLLFSRKRYNPFHNVIVRKYISYADKRLAVSQSLQEALIQNGIRGVDVVHTGARIEDWVTHENETRVFKQKYRLEGKHVLLFGGRLGEEKGAVKVLETLRLVRQRVPNTVLLVAGSDTRFSNEIRRVMRVCGVEENVIVTGWIPRDELRMAYASSNVVLVPSLYLDPFPRIVIEGMAAGRPVIGASYGGAREIIQDGITGYVINPFSVEEMATKVVDLLTNVDKARKFGEAAKHRIEAEFNLEDVVKKYIVIYKSRM